MPKTVYKRAGFLVCLMLVLVTPVLLTCPTWRQVRLDRALLAAVENDHAALVLSLLHAGANPNTRAEEGGGALWTMMRAKLGASPTQRERGIPVITMAVVFKDKDGIEKLKSLLDFGADPNNADGAEMTALHHAAHNGDSASVQLLLDRRANVNVQNFMGDTPLMEACAWGQMEVVRLLLKAGADPNIKNHSGGTALQSLRGGNQGIARMLRQAGASK